MRGETDLMDRNGGGCREMVRIDYQILFAVLLLCLSVAGRPARLLEGGEEDVVDVEISEGGAGLGDALYNAFEELRGGADDPAEYIPPWADQSESDGDDDDDNDSKNDEDDDEGHETGEPAYVVDEHVQHGEKGKVVATLILDEITEYYDAADDTWYKVELHLQNRGEMAICGVTFDISEADQVAETWTLERVKKTNHFKLEWPFNISAIDPLADSRYFGIVTQGSEVPDVSIHSLVVCTDDEVDSHAEAIWEQRQHEMEADDPNVPTINLLKKEADDADHVTLQVDEMSEWIELVVDEVRKSKLEEGKKRRVLVNAHINNRAAVPLCGIELWVYNFKTVTEHWSVVPAAGDKDELETFMLPSTDSRLEPSQSHYFGFSMPFAKDFPNIVPVRAIECPDAEPFNATAPLGGAAGAVGAGGAPKPPAPKAPAANKPPPVAAPPKEQPKPPAADNKKPPPAPPKEQPKPPAADNKKPPPAPPKEQEPKPAAPPADNPAPPAADNPAPPAADNPPAPPADNPPAPPAAADNPPAPPADNPAPPAADNPPAPPADNQAPAAPPPADQPPPQEQPQEQPPPPPPADAAVAPAQRRK